MLLRTEEDKQAAKASRMKQHLGFGKAKVQANAQAVCASEMTDLSPQVQGDSLPSVMEQIQKQIASMQAQIAKLLRHTKLSQLEQSIALKSNLQSYKQVQGPDQDTVSSAEKMDMPQTVAILPILLWLMLKGKSCERSKRLGIRKILQMTV